MNLPKKPLSVGVLTVAVAVALAACRRLRRHGGSGGSGAADTNATIQIGSLYEPQNLDNTAGGGQGVTEAFNGNVYEGLFQLTDDGKVEPPARQGLHGQRRRPHLHVHAARRRDVPLRRGADRGRRQVQHRAGASRRTRKSARKSSSRGHQRHRRPRTTRPSSSRCRSRSISLPLQPQLRLDRQRRGDEPHDDRGRHRPVQAGRVEARLRAGARPVRRLLGRRRRRTARWSSTTSPTRPR